tara:strand:- start:1578 stop:1727 length:150 start_codon:yes stop_codon:yes gene_type:complete
MTPIIRDSIDWRLSKLKQNPVIFIQPNHANGTHGAPAKAGHIYMVSYYF